MQLILHMSGSWPESLGDLWFSEHFNLCPIQDKSDQKPLGTPPKISIDTKTDVMDNVYIISLFKNTFLGTYPETNMEKNTWNNGHHKKDMSYSINFQGLNLMWATAIRYPFLVFTRLLRGFEACTFQKGDLEILVQKQSGYGRMKSGYNCLHWGC